MSCENCGSCKCRVTVKDNDGHAYLIPTELKDEFQEALELTTKHRQGSKEWHAAHDALNDNFSGFMVG